MNKLPSKRAVVEPASEPRPFLGTWGRVYAAVLLFLIALIALFRIFERVFTP